MKTLFVSPARAAYGSERSMLALLQARQFEAEVVCPAGGALEQELHELGVRVHPLEFGRYSVRHNPFWHLNFYWRFIRILKKSRPDVVVINLDGNTPLVTLAARRTGFPVVRFCRFEFKPPTRWLDRWCWLQCAAVICPSDLVKGQVWAWAPKRFHSQVHRLYESYMGHMASAEEVAAFRQRSNLGDTRLIGYIGRIHRMKRIELAIRALAQVKRHFDNVHLVIIGGHDGSAAGAAYQAELEQCAAELNVSDSVTLCGYYPPKQLAAAIAACSVCVLPSESESFGMVLMEAWAQSVPTVATDIAGCREISHASGAGLLFPVGDHCELALLIESLLTHPVRALAIGERGRQWVATHCDPGVYANRFERLLAEVCA